MITRMTTVLLLLGSMALHAETEENLTKKFSATPGGNLVLDVGFGSIEVKAGETKEVVIQVTRKVSLGSDSAEKKFLEDQPVTMSQSDNTVTIESKGKPKNTWSLWGRKKTSAKYVISVPSEFNTQLKTSGGAIKIDGLTGTTKAETSGGQLKFTHLRGPLEGRTSGGKIELSDCEGELSIRTSGGSIDVEGGTGDLNGKTSGGSISVSKFTGPVNINTSGGGIRINDVAGAVSGSTSGGGINASIPTKVIESIELKTSGGGITLRVHDEAAFDLDASTSAGNVSSELTVVTENKKKKNQLVGPVNGGGNPVRLRTSGGNIRIGKI